MKEYVGFEGPLPLYGYPTSFGAHRMKEYVGFEGCSGPGNWTRSCQAHRMKEYVGFEGTLVTRISVSPRRGLTG